MHVVVAPDKFKGSLTAGEVARHVAAGIAAEVPDAAVLQLPVADGGDGTVAAAVAAGYERIDVVAQGPIGQRVATAFALRDQVAVVELADVSGLARLPPDALAPLRASSYGTGEVIRAALDRGARTIVLGIGGSASTDGGAGMLQALGLRVLDAAGRELDRGGAALAAVHRVDATTLDPRVRDVRFVVACDVDNPLLGPRGAAAVYGPQKGASPDEVRLLDAALGRWADVVQHEIPVPGQPVHERSGAGAAGGVGHAAIAVLDAQLRPGIDLVLQLVRFADALPGAGLVITGEGSLDEQTLSGKAPAGVAAAAGEAGVPVVTVSGRLALTPAQLRAAGIRQAYALSDLEPDLRRCQEHAGPLLERLARTVARDWVRPRPATAGVEQRTNPDEG